MRSLINIAIIGIIGFIGVFLQPSCTKYEAPDMIRMDGFDSDSIISTAIHRKVLWVNMDGAVGSIVERSIPAGGTIAEMLKNSKYSWIGLSDERVLPNIQEEDPVTWSTMLTGVIPEKHHISSNSYISNFNYDPVNPDEKMVQYPNILHHIAESNIENPTLCVTPWAKLNNNMLKAAQLTVTTSGDEETKDVVLQHLAESDFEFILVGFSGMLEAGKNGGFTENNAAYLSALQRIDGYLGEFLQAIGERENAFFEDWLIIVTSNHGGTPDGRYGGNSAAERNNFGIFYYSHYEEQRMLGEKTYGAYFDKNKTHAVVYDTIPDINQQRYLLRENSEFAFESVLRMLPKRDGTYGNGGDWGKVLGKHDWGLYRQHGSTSLRLQGLQLAANTYNDPLLHNVGATASRRGTDNSTAWKYTVDGVVAQSGNRNLSYQQQPEFEHDWQRESFKSSSTLQIGGNRYVHTGYYFSELRIWNRDFTPPIISELARMTDISESNPHYGNLIGYWKFHPDEVTGTSADGDTIIIRNQIPGGLDMYYINNKDNAQRETRFAEIANTLPHKIRSGDIIFENTLVVPQILYWLNLTTTVVLDGFRFIDNYAHSEDWRDVPEE